MKRIVREISPFKIWLKMPPRGVIIDWEIMEDLDGFLRLNRHSIELPSGVKIEQFISFDSNRESKDRLIEQITFDQAFKDLSEQGKPIIKVLPNHSVWWVYRYSKLEMLELFIFIFESGYINSTVITWDKFINSACEDAQYYQSDSHLDFLLHDLPTLIRMAREGV
jgi:hypothetical protein